MFNVPADLVEAVQTGDGKACNELWKQAYGDVRAVCYAILHNNADAEDVAMVVMETFLMKVIPGGQLHEVRAAGGYLRMMTVRAAVRYKKRRADSLSTLSEGPEIDRSPQEPEFHDSVNADQRASIILALRRLAHCREHLSPKAYQAVLLKTFRDGISDAEIGDRLGGSKAYIGKLIKSSKATLRKCIEQGLNA